MTQKCSADCHCPLCDARMAMVMMLDDTSYAAWLQQEQRAAAQSLGMTLCAGRFRAYTNRSADWVPPPPSMRVAIARYGHRPSTIEQEEENQ